MIISGTRKRQNVSYKKNSYNNEILKISYFQYIERRNLEKGGLHSVIF